MVKAAKLSSWNLIRLIVVELLFLKISAGMKMNVLGALIHTSQQLRGSSDESIAAIISSVVGGVFVIGL
ncbi:15564_t:CDS:2 [Funneliformis geosporum]|uniref:5750_t:CDS:1 n=1 Tax=Funneliformis geosporum TaxID=1117311 RepID=A0A9W4WKH2_9GLOM|nr:15564_t:CDS:2 [Funneliformis geosporum]CAI2168719.1 5750_t:CDS:2 [Funneliformis geosporum]